MSKGRQQAEYLRDYLCDVQVDLVITSKLIRTHETAGIVLQKHANVPVLSVEDLAEISWGNMEGSPTVVAKSLVDQWNAGDYHGKITLGVIHPPSVATPEGETPAQVEKRAIPAIYALLNRPEQTIIFICMDLIPSRVLILKVHGRLLRIILSSLLYHNLDKMASFTHHNTSINLVDAIIETDSEKLPQEDGLPQETQVFHPPNIKFVPVFLDNRDHLPPDFQGRNTN